ncbi:MAG: hypothetical protein E7600_08285 [Ruminococcaceae bacterium]|nr:hypothetical protein [Oscillospiraceae bacterium]
MRRNSWSKALVLPFISFVLSTKVHADSIKELMDKAKELSENLDSKKIWDMLLSGIASGFSSLSQSFALSFCVLTAGVVFSSLKDSFSENESLFDFISSCIMIIAVSSPLLMCIGKAAEHSEAMCGIMVSLIPTMIALYSAGGSTITAAMSAAALPFTVSAIQTISTGLVLPLIKSASTLTCVNTLCKKTNLSSAISLIKSVCLWVTGLGFTLFTGVLALKSHLNTGADNLVIKGLRYGASKFIPIAGGMVSESMTSVITSVSLIKSITGISGILLIVYAMLPPLTLCLATKLTYSLLSFYAKSTCQNDAASLLDGLGGIINILIALCIGCGVTLMAVLAIFIRSNITM